MKGRLQRVKPSPRIFSDWKPVNAGVPQGTKLGPWLFLLMINDLAIQNDQFDGDMMKYTDDTNVYIAATVNWAYKGSLPRIVNFFLWGTYTKVMLRTI